MLGDDEHVEGTRHADRGGDGAGRGQGRWEEEPRLDQVRSAGGDPERCRDDARPRRQVDGHGQHRPTVHAERERTGDRGRRPVLQYRLEWQDAPRGRERGREEPTDDGGWKGRGSRHDREDRDPGLHERRFGEKTASGLVPVGEEEERGLLPGGAEAGGAREDDGEIALLRVEIVVRGWNEVLDGTSAPGRISLDAGLAGEGDRAEDVTRGECRHHPAEELARAICGGAADARRDVDARDETAPRRRARRLEVEAGQREPEREGGERPTPGGNAQTTPGARGNEEERHDEEREERQGYDDMEHAEAEGEGHRPSLRRHAIHSPPRSAAAAR